MQIANERIGGGSQGGNGGHSQGGDSGGIDERDVVVLTDSNF